MRLKLLKRVRVGQKCYHKCFWNGKYVPWTDDNEPCTIIEYSKKRNKVFYKQFDSFTKQERKWSASLFGAFTDKTGNTMKWCRRFYRLTKSKRTNDR